MFTSNSLYKAFAFSDFRTVYGHRGYSSPKMAATSDDAKHGFAAKLSWGEREGGVKRGAIQIKFAVIIMIRTEGRFRQIQFRSMITNTILIFSDYFRLFSTEIG